MRYRLFGLFCLVVFFSLGLLVACGGAATPAPTTPPATTTPVPTTPTPPPAETPGAPPSIAHSLKDRANCLVCHETGAAGAPQYPADHVGRGNETCQGCHVPPTLIPHSLEGRADCLVCHETGVGGAPQVPADHAGRTNDLCQNCHVTE